MIKIHFISPYPELRKTIDAVFENHRFSGRISKTVSVVAVNELPEIKIGNCDVIIARGYAAQYLVEEGINIPVVDIDISAYDVFRSVQECSSLYSPKKIAFIGFYSAFSGVESFTEMLGCQVKVYVPKDYDEIDRILKTALSEGCDAVVAGQYVVNKAKKMRINSTLIRVGEEAVYRAIDEAVRTYEIVTQERIKSKVYEIITHNSKDGILYIGRDGDIQACNQVALDMFGVASSLYTLENNFPQLFEGYKRALEKGEEIAGELKNIKNITISIDYVPVVDGGRAEGVVITFQNITKVQQIERDIRKKLSDRGLYAKNEFSDIVHESSVLDETIEIAKRYAVSSSNIMLVGETGTGKEIFAQSIHNASKRKKGPFVAVNCAAFPENLLESELFGYVEGAFTGAAKKGKMGLFELAHNGTIFLDEIGEIPMSMQSKLLRVLQEKEVRRIGDDKVTSVDVRIICATNKNLKSMVIKGEFRQDLLYRLDVLKIFIQPLRKRREDILPLFNMSLEKICFKGQQAVPELDQDARQMLLEYSFPGNVRELENIVERVNVIRLGEKVISCEDMKNAIYPDDVSEEIFYGDSVSKPKYVRSSENESEKIINALEECGNNMTKTAKYLGMDRSTLWRKMNKYGIQK
ncbi:sigma 54-interacting transcriptional regulator [Anaerotignum faecicola]|nr:sigma 54-interacting transcriptional regulator [Anaerotignum faecicola]